MTSHLDRPVLCANGNFHAEKMYMKNPENDEELRDGRMFAVKRLEYNRHLKARDSDPAEVHIPKHNSCISKADFYSEITVLKAQGSEPRDC
jgi:hypothetical protein